MNESLSPRDGSAPDAAVQIELSVARPTAHYISSLATDPSIGDVQLARQLELSPEAVAYALRVGGGIATDESLEHVVHRARRSLRQMPDDAATYAPLSIEGCLRAPLLAHSLQAARLARALATERADAAYLAGLLHDLVAFSHGSCDDAGWHTARILKGWNVSIDICEAAALHQSELLPSCHVARALWLAHPIADAIEGTVSDPQLVTQRARQCGLTMSQLEDLAFGAGKSPLERVLTVTQRLVMRTIVGKTSQEAAVALGVSSKTVDKHVDNACRRLGVSGRKEAIPVLIRDGVIAP